MSAVLWRGLCGVPGFYEREVVESAGKRVEIPVPRFECRSLGPKPASGRTFSVLPAEVIPRRLWSLGWVLKVALWCSDSLVAALDELSTAGMAVETRQLARVLKVLGIACERLHEHPVGELEVSPEGHRVARAVELRRACLSWETSGRGPPGSLVIEWNRLYKGLLLDVRMR